MAHRHSTQGFNAPGIIIIVSVLGLVGGGAYLYIQQLSNASRSAQQSETATVAPSTVLDLPAVTSRLESKNLTVKNESAQGDYYAVEGSVSLISLSVNNNKARIYIEQFRTPEAATEYSNSEFAGMADGESFVSDVYFITITNDINTGKQLDSLLIATIKEALIDY